jgi:hypothetical protein
LTEEYAKMLWSIYLLLIFSGLLIKESKIYDSIVIIFMGFLAFANTDAADYETVYLPIYADPSIVKDVAPGWGLLCGLGHILGLTYNGFACILTIAAMLLLLWAARKVGAHSSYMFSLFLVYPGLMSLVQFRQFVASAVGAVAVTVLISNNRFRYPLFIVLVYTGFLIHTSCIILLLLLLVPFLNSLGKSMRVVVVFLVGVISVVLLRHAEYLATVIFDENKTDIYLGAFGGQTSASRLAGMVNVAGIIGVALLMYAYYTHTGNNEKQQALIIGSNQNLRYIQYIMFFDMMNMILIPFVVITNDFMRFERYAFTYSLTAFSMSKPAECDRDIDFYKPLTLMLCLLFAYLYNANAFDSIYGALLSVDSVPSFFTN